MSRRSNRCALIRPKRRQASAVPFASSPWVLRPVVRLGCGRVAPTHRLAGPLPGKPVTKPGSEDPRPGFWFAAVETTNPSRGYGIRSSGEVHEGHTSYRPLKSPLGLGRHATNAGSAPVGDGRRHAHAFGSKVLLTKPIANASPSLYRMVNNRPYGTERSLHVAPTRASIHASDRGAEGAHGRECMEQPRP